MLPDHLTPLELYTAPDTGEPYLETTFGRTRVLARYAPQEATRVDAAWLAEHPEAGTDGMLAASRIGGVTFAPCEAAVVDLAAENAGRAWPSPLVLGASIARQHTIHTDPETDRWAVERRS